MNKFKKYIDSEKAKELKKTGFYLNKDGTVSISHDTSNNKGGQGKRKKLKESLIGKAKGALGIKADHEKTFDQHAAKHNKEDHHDYLTKHSSDIHKDPHEDSARQHFKAISMNINHNLIKHHEKGHGAAYDKFKAATHKRKGLPHDPDDEDKFGAESHVHHTILKHAKPLGKKMTLYHGTDHDFGNAAKSSERGIIHSPAHISTSHDHNVSKRFGKHIVAIHANKKDKGVYLGGKDDDYKEKETVIPAGTKLKHIKSHKTSDGYTIHHFKIHHQDDHEAYDK